MENLKEVSCFYCCLCFLVVININYIYIIDIESLFAAAEDFSEILDDAGKSKGHGTLGEIFNRNKDSEKQLAWERSRLKGAKTYYSKNKRFSKKGNSSNNKKGGKKPFKKR